MATVLGAVAAGDGVTADAVAEILRLGGNACDAALAGLFVACVSEPVLCSLAGGGFLMIRPADAPPLLYDFYSQTPQHMRPVDELDFLPVEANFGTARQQFHIGHGSVATPGLVAGAFAAHADFGRLSMQQVVAPAVRHARDGVPVSPLQSFILEAVAPIFLWSQEARALFGSRRKSGGVLQPGERLRMTAFAQVLEDLAVNGPDHMYSGNLGRALARAQRSEGGSLQEGDLEDYTVARREPLGFQFAGEHILTNPLPSCGGALIAGYLSLLDSGPTDAQTLVRAMLAVANARTATGPLDETDQAEVGRVLKDAMQSEYRNLLEARAVKTGGTTHLSVIDSDGNVVALSVSNGEGAGHLWPDTDIMLNNMLGEEDTNPQGFFNWRPDSRVSSMMAPTVLTRENGVVVALGSGGSNRIRTAIMQVIVNYLKRGMTLEAAIAAPRLHTDGGAVHVEFGHSGALRDGLSEEFGTVENWPDQNFFFGGVHAVSFDPRTGEFEAAGDPRRGGVGLVVAE